MPFISSMTIQEKHKLSEGMKIDQDLNIPIITPFDIDKRKVRNWQQKRKRIKMFKWANDTGCFSKSDMSNKICAISNIENHPTLKIGNHPTLKIENHPTLKMLYKVNKFKFNKAAISFPKYLKVQE